MSQFLPAMEKLFAERGKCRKRHPVSRVPWRRYREHMKALYHWLVLTIIRTHEPTIGRLVACLFPVGLGAVLGTSSFFGCQCLRGI